MPIIRSSVITTSASVVGALALVGAVGAGDLPSFPDAIGGMPRRRAERANQAGNR